MVYLDLSLMQRTIRLRNELRKAQLAKPQSRLLHLPAVIPNNPAKRAWENCFLMQLRLDLETQVRYFDHAKRCFPG